MLSFSTATRMEQAYRVEADTFGELQVTLSGNARLGPYIPCLFRYPLRSTMELKHSVL